jgi:hypothetical protein
MYCKVFVNMLLDKDFVIFLTEDEEVAAVAVAEASLVASLIDMFHYKIIFLVFNV